MRSRYVGNHNYCIINFIGSLELCMRHLLIQCIAVDKLFTLGMLNDRIASFGYGSDITNKPSTLSQHHISLKGHIKQSGKHYYSK